MSDSLVNESILRGPLPSRSDLSDEEFERLVWAFRGIVKEQERERAFWAATNDNLSDAFRELEEKDRQLKDTYDLIREDLELASRVQSTLLPSALSALSEDLEIAVFHRQLAQVGGDYYDFFPLEDNGYAIGVFDISGHGVSAALVMSYLKAQFVAAIGDGLSPSGTVQRVNESVLSFLRGARKYATVNYVSFASNRLTYVNGGGNGLLVRDRGVFEFAKRDQFLGVRENPYHEASLPFESGDLLALYTDGIYETQDTDGHDYTKRRLNALITEHADLPVRDLVQLCREDYERFRERDTDDITLVLARRRGNHDH